MKTVGVIMAVICVLVMGSVTVSAQDSQGWKFEITPYVWLAGYDGTISADNRDVDVKQDFSDLVDKVDWSGSIQMNAVYRDRLVIYSQADYLALSQTSDWNLVTAKVSSDLFFLSGAVGYRFHGGITKKSTTDVLVGVRYLNSDSEVKIYSVGSRKRTQNIIDGILMVRPSIPLSEKWRFNPTLAIGAGDSDLVYELSPQFEYSFNDMFTGRIGYRRLYYEYKGDRNLEWKGAVSGIMIGLGVKF